MNCDSTSNTKIGWCLFCITQYIADYAASIMDEYLRKNKNKENHVSSSSLTEGINFSIFTQHPVTLLYNFDCLLTRRQWMLILRLQAYLVFVKQRTTDHATNKPFFDLPITKRTKSGCDANARGLHFLTDGIIRKSSRTPFANGWWEWWVCLPPPLSPFRFLADAEGKISAIIQCWDSREEFSYWFCW